MITRYFDLLEETLGVNGLADELGQIFNCDETALPLQHNPPKVVSLATQRHLRICHYTRRKGTDDRPSWPVLVLEDTLSDLW